MTKYNGWTNYETWRVNLEIFDGGSWRRYSAQDLEEYANDIIEQSGNGLALDYARAFLSEVNWYEIASAMKNAYEDENEMEIENA